MAGKSVVTVVLLLTVLITASFVSAALADDFTIGYLQLKKDGRYGKKRTYARFLLHPLGRPYSGAQVALKEVRFHAAEIGKQFALERIKGKNTPDLVASIQAMRERGIHFFVLDLPAETAAEVASATTGQDILLFNISARENVLRQEQCQEHLLHIIPSNAMLMDALVQLLVFRKWSRVLLLTGPLPGDVLMADSLQRSAKRFGVKIAEERPFLLSNDPRERDQNNVALLTANADYDVVFVADSDGEFARNVPYQTVKPRPVVGSEGLAAAAWHWAWERHGAPQLEKRFEKKSKRPMKSFDWAAWMAVKSIAAAVQKTKTADFQTIKTYLLSEEVILDGFKGNRLNFRPWNHQLRQPILLITHNWVVDRAPLKGFQHQLNHMDLLGFDQRESECEF